MKYIKIQLKKILYKNKFFYAKKLELINSKSYELFKKIHLILVKIT